MRQTAWIGAGVAVAMAAGAWLYLRPASRPGTTVSPVASQGGAATERPGGQARAAGEVSSMALAPQGPELRGEVLLRIGKGMAEHLPFSFAVILVPERGFPVRVVRDEKAVLVSPVRWGTVDKAPWVGFEDVGGEGTSLRFTGLFRGRWTAWADSGGDLAEAYASQPFTPNRATLYAPPVRFEVSAAPAIATLSPLEGGDTGMGGGAVAAAPGPVTVRMMEVGGGIVTYLLQATETYRIDADGTPRAIRWSTEDPPKLSVVGGDAFLVAHPADEEGAPDFDRRPIATRLATFDGSLPATIEFSRMRPVAGPQGDVEVFCVDADGSPARAFHVFTEVEDAGRGLLDDAIEGHGIASGLPAGRRRIRVARSADSLFGPGAATALVEVRPGSVPVAYFTLPRR